MDYRWLLIVPVWGDRYIDIFCAVTLPALKLAAAAFGERAVLILYCDDDARLRQAVGELRVEYRPVPGPDRSFYSMAQAHREALLHAQPNDRVVLLTADLVLSANSLQSCESHFQQGKRLVCCAGMRVDDAQLPPQTTSGRDLLAWGWEHRHPMTRESTWPDGHSYDVWRMYFAQNGEAACRLCSPHPIALITDGRRIHFGPTVDVNVTTNYSINETHLVTNPDELAMIELSPHDKEFLLTEPMLKRFEQSLPSLPPFIGITNERHRWYFSQKIVITGSGGDCGDEFVVNRLLHGG